MAAPDLQLGNGTRVRATQSVGQVCAGDVGAVAAAWRRANVAVCWDKDGVIRRVHRKRLELEPVPGAHPTRLLNAVYALPMGNRWLSLSGTAVYLGDWPYADDGDGGLPEWFFQTNEDLFFTYVEVYSDGSAVWTGGMGVIWKRPGGALITRQQLGAELDAWTRENL